MIRYRSKVLLAIIVLGSLLSLSAGGVETIEYCDTQTISGQNQEDNHSISLFDPALGNLVQVDLTLDLELEQNYNLENEGHSSQAVDAQSDSVLKITLPDNSEISANVSSSISEELAAYDGQTDFKGSSGKTVEGIKSRGSAEKQNLEVEDFVASFQNETASLPADILVKSWASGNIVFRQSTVAESKVCVTYTYEPKGSG